MSSARGDRFTSIHVDPLQRGQTIPLYIQFSVFFPHLNVLLIPRVCSLQYCLIPPCVTKANGGELSSSRPRDGGCGDCLWGRSERDSHRAAGQKELRERRAPSLGEFPLNTPRSEVENTKMTSARRRGLRVVGPPVRFRPNALLVPAATFSDHTVSSWCAHARHACLHRNQAAER